MSGAPEYVDALRASEHVTIGRHVAEVSSTDLTEVTRPVILAFGPLSLCATPAEAIALGNALIRVAHHYTAALAEHQQGQIAAAVTAQAVQS
ncbi:MAG: hypothetical protein ACTHJ9_05350 [Rhodanobacter sp.]